MLIEVEELEEGQSKPFAGAWMLGQLGFDDQSGQLIEPTEINAQASRKGSQVRVRGEITTAVELECDRCLRHIKLPIATNFDVTYISAVDAAKTETAALNTDDLNFSVYENEAIDIDALAQEQIALALPARLLCTDECKGLCSICGTDQNTATCRCDRTPTDPRWAILKDLQF